MMVCILLEIKKSGSDVISNARERRNRKKAAAAAKAAAQAANAAAKSGSKNAKANGNTLVIFMNFLTL